MGEVGVAGTSAKGEVTRRDGEADWRAHRA